MKQEMTIGTLFIVSAPSGAGKTSLVKEVLSSIDDITLSVSHTTRTQRETEIDNVHYHFVNEQQFIQMVNENIFVEHAKVFNNYYGTSGEHIQQVLDLGKDLILEIDWQGALQVKEKFPNCCSIFILPPSKEALLKRLTARGQDSEIIIQARMAQAVSEMTHHAQFDFIVINDVFADALADICSIIKTQRLNKEKQIIKHKNLISDLLQKF